MWKVTDRGEKLDAFQFRCSRRILGVAADGDKQVIVRQNVTSDELRRHVGVELERTGATEGR